MADNTYRISVRARKIRDYCAFDILRRLATGWTSRRARVQGCAIGDDRRGIDGRDSLREGG
jgi:hypothetical protein